MRLAADDRLGPYEIVAHIGAGGMGDVYRARDPRVGRDVAIKVSAVRFGQHVEREARAIAALNHPNICALFDVGPNYLVLELVEGESPERLYRIDAALAIARQLVDALEAAHANGVVHRDLKPANLRVKPDGMLKVLDFGVAKLRSDASPVEGTAPATATLPAPNESAIMGTAGYMAPEQIRGDPVDKRVDIWAFGVVLYQMLSGRRAFQGETTSEVLRAVAFEEPDWHALPALTPASILRLLKRCLEKDPKRRLPDISVARLEIDDASTAQAPVAPAVVPPGRRWAWLAAGVALGGMMAAALLWKPASGAAPVVARFSIALNGGVLASNFPTVALSNDGRTIVYATTAGLFARSIDDPTPRLIPGTNLTRGAVNNPVFSPDGQSIAFYAGDPDYTNGAIKRIAATGGATVTLLAIDFPPYGMSWDANGLLVARSFGQGRKGVYRLSALGGPPELIAEAGDEFFAQPSLLPDGRSVLATVATGVAADRWDNARIVVLKAGQRKTLIEGGSDARYVSTGHLLYVRRNALLAVRFDPQRLEVIGKPIEVLDDVNPSTTGGAASGAAQYATSKAGSLVYVTNGTSLYELARVDRRGAVKRLAVPPGPYFYPRVSLDGTRVAVGSDTVDEADIWVGPLAKEGPLRRLTFGGRNRFPIWSADGRHVTYQSDRDGDRGIFWQLADGSGPAERLTTAPAGTSHEPESWSPSGESLLFRVTTGSRYALWSLSLKSRTAAPFGGIESSVPSNATFSPDGRWVAYMSRDAERFLISAQPFPPTGAKYQIAQGGLYPSWSRDGRELYYFHDSGDLAAASVRSQPLFSLGPPSDLWNVVARRVRMAGSVPHRGIDPTVDGGFLAAVWSDTDQPVWSQLRVVLNWFHELEERVPAPN